jgi:hypothetical protein
MAHDLFRQPQEKSAKKQSHVIYTLYTKHTLGKRFEVLRFERRRPLTRAELRREPLVAAPKQTDVWY